MTGPAAAGVRRGEPPADRGDDRADADHGQRAEPGGPAVGAVAEGVQERHGPQGVGRPVHGLEDARADAVSQQRDDGDDAQQVERERAEAEPQRLVGAQEREHEVHQPQLRVGVEVEGGDVGDHEAGPGQGGRAVQVAGAEAAQPRHRPPGAGDDAEDQGDGEEHECDHAGAAAEGPEGGAHAATSRGQSPTRTTRCRWSTRRAV